MPPLGAIFVDILPERCRNVERSVEGFYIGALIFTGS
jgi:hypothetical protein